MIDAFEPQLVDEDEEVIRQGAAGDFIYIIDQGMFQVLIGSVLGLCACVCACARVHARMLCMGVRARAGACLCACARVACVCGPWHGAQVLVDGRVVLSQARPPYRYLPAGRLNYTQHAATHVGTAGAKQGCDGRCTYFTRPKQQ